MRTICQPKNTAKQSKAIQSLVVSVMFSVTIIIIVIIVISVIIVIIVISVIKVTSDTAPPR